MTVRSPSFLDRVSRYRTTAYDPRENRTTEILAAVCEHVAGFARHLALRWLDPEAGGARGETCAPTARAHSALLAIDPSAPVLVRTQVPAPGRFVDLELRFMTSERPSRTAALVWVEVKHGTDPHSEQIPDYVDARAPYPGAVVLLAPRRDLPADPGQCPPSVPQRSWQATARSIQAFAADAPVDRWLLAQLTDYLHEEGLMDLTAIGPEHLTALAYGRQARDALMILTDIAAGYTIRHYREHAYEETVRNRPAHGIGYWQSWDAPALGGTADPWDGAYFDWNLVESHGTPFAAGAVFVMAGLSKPKGSEFAAPGSEWHRRIDRGLPGSDGLIRFERWTGGDVERLQRVALPQDVLRGRTLEEQGESLGRWIVETFRALEAHGPPPQA